MDENTRERLIDLNRTFYQTFAQEFSATRQRLQPGVMRVIEQISHQDSILDLGCGNGQLCKMLINRGHQGLYTGLDSNAEFLEIARQNLPENNNITLLQRDITLTNWEQGLPVESYDLIFAFAVLHHIPGFELRRKILQKIAHLSAPGARFIHSEWQLLNSPRLRSREWPGKMVSKSLRASIQTGRGEILGFTRFGKGYNYTCQSNIPNPKKFECEL